MTCGCIEHVYIVPSALELLSDPPQATNDNVTTGSNRPILSFLSLFIIFNFSFNIKIEPTPESRPPA